MADVYAKEEQSCHQAGSQSGQPCSSITTCHESHPRSTIFLPFLGSVLNDLHLPPGPPLTGCPAPPSTTTRGPRIQHVSPWGSHSSHSRAVALSSLVPSLRPLDRAGGPEAEVPPVFPEARGHRLRRACPVLGQSSAARLPALLKLGDLSFSTHSRVRETGPACVRSPLRGLISQNKTVLSTVKGEDRTRGAFL